MHKLYRWLIGWSLWLLVLLPATIMAQEAAPASPQFPPYQIEQITTAQGLSPSSIHAVIQDRQGFMWFGTLSGLIRYDGYRFETFEHDPENSLSLSDNLIEVLFEDSKGVLWVGTSGGGLNQFDRQTGHFKRFEHDANDRRSLSSNTISAIFEDSDGDLWVGTNGGGLNLFDRLAQRFTRYQNDPADANSLSNNTIGAIAEDDFGNLWFGTGGGGLERFDPTTQSFVHHQHRSNDPASLHDNFVTAVYRDNNNTLWIGTQTGGLAKLDPATGQFTHYPYEGGEPNNQRDDAIRAIHEDRQGNLWVGFLGNGLRLFDRQTVTFKTIAEQNNNLPSLSGQNVRTIAEDKSGILWIGTAGSGLYKLIPSTKSFFHFQHDPNDPFSLSGNIVQSFYEDHQGTIWVGTKGGGLNIFDRATFQFRHFQNDPANPDSLSSNDVLAIFEDSKRTLWIGTSSGLNKFDRQQNKFIRYQNDPNDPHSLSSNIVSAILEDSDGDLWIGTSNGLDRFSPNSQQFNHYQHNPFNPYSLRKGRVQVIFEDSKGILWVGTDSGLNQYHKQSGRFSYYEHQPAAPFSLSQNGILAIHEARNGVFWIGTNGGGLNRLDFPSETFTHYREKDGLANDTVYGILEDESGMLWLSTNHGLSRFDPETALFQHYDAADGLQSNEFSANAHLLSANGDLYFGGVNGFNVFQPQTVQENGFIPDLVFTSLTQGGEAVDEAQAPEQVAELILQWPENFFEFEVAALSFDQPLTNSYAYKLEGYDADWQYVGHERNGRYRNLPAGKYKLLVKGSNNDGLWSRDDLVLPVTIVPPVWQTLWFRTMLIILTVGGIILAFRLRVRRIRSQTVALTQLVDERTHILAQRTDELEQRRQVAEGLREILVILNSDQSLEKSLDHIVAQAALSSTANAVIIYQFDLPEQPLVLAQTANCQKDILPIIVDRMADIGRSGKPLIVPNLMQYLIGMGLSTRGVPQHFQAILGVPLLVGGELYGCLLLLYRRIRSFSDDEINLGLTFADQATLAIANAQLRDKAEQTAVATERSRLARDLHDAVTQTLFSASLVAEVLPATWDKSQVEGAELLQELRQLNRGALAEMRSLLLELRPAALVHTRLDHLMGQIAEACAGRTGAQVDLTTQGKCRLPGNVHITFYRIAQETLNNIVKHSEATAVAISLICNTTTRPSGRIVEATLRISDNGQGFDNRDIPASRLGLTIMRERAQAVGAKFNIQSALDQGTEICVQWTGEYDE